jgi:hypothetical protein
MSDGENIIHGTNDLLNHATDFYKNLFGPAIDSGIRLEEQIWNTDEIINPEEREIMDRTFSEEEIKNAIDLMESNKAAGPDGIPAEFYKVCWEIIKIDMMVAFNDFHRHAIDLKRINYGIITLIPQGPDADRIQKYRPICLLQVLFKIFTKVLTIRAIPIMDKVIHPCQTAFIKGRFITDGVALLQEVLRETKFRKQEGVVLKIDFEKAYDKVNWEFLFDCCRQKGFSSNWLVWIKKQLLKEHSVSKSMIKWDHILAVIKGLDKETPLLLFSSIWQQTA